MLTSKNRSFSALFVICSIINKKPYLILFNQLSKANPCLVYLRHTLVSHHFFAFNFSCTASKKNILANKQHGFSMIELLVAMLIFSIGLLGLASLQVTGMRMTRDAELMGRASLYVSSMAEKIRASPSSLVDTVDWNRTIKTALPSGFGEVTAVNRMHTISVSWLESQDSTSNNSWRSYELVIQL
ncbi:MAG: type IV pilus assembly protein PilV [Oleiphilaceae bacterium]|jgi:type IV pilus assembly protein PilV